MGSEGGTEELKRTYRQVYIADLSNHCKRPRHQELEETCAPKKIGHEIHGKQVSCRRRDKLSQHRKHVAHYAAEARFT